MNRNRIDLSDNNAIAYEVARLQRQHYNHACRAAVHGGDTDAIDARFRDSESEITDHLTLDELSTVMSLALSIENTLFRRALVKRERDRLSGTNPRGYRHLRW